VLGIGQSSLDAVGVLARLPRPGEKLELRDWRELPGGQVATAVLACARLGLRCAYAGSVGDDPAAQAVLAPLARAGVDLAGVRRVAGAPTRRALVLVEEGSGERTILAYRAAALALRPADLDRRAVATSRALLLDAEDPEAARWAAGVAREAGVPSILDVDRCDRERLALARLVDFPIVSQGFAEQFSGDASPDEALRALADAGARMAVVTRGERGAVARFEGRSCSLAALRVAVRDTTGAGDVFRGAFAWGLLQGWSPEAVVRAANAAAGLSCRGLGAQGALPDAAEVAAAGR
jgi:sulfofructose kinase